MPTTRSLQELVIAAHFQAPLPFTVMDLASWVQHFSELPIIQQLPPLASANLPMPGTPLQFQFAVEASPMPRMLLRTADNRYSVQLQNDRFGFGWHRTEPIGDPAEYPGFEEHREHWKRVLDQFESWTESRFQQRPAHRLIELNYNNAVPLERNGQQRRLSEIFKFVQLGGRKVAGFNVSWAESIYPITDKQQPSKGVVNCFVGLGIAPPAVNVLAFTFTGMASVAPGVQSEHILNDIHAKIREIYESAIITDAD
jgi:uncharacterized protein (TIGR04255 family)